MAGSCNVYILFLMRNCQYTFNYLYYRYYKQNSSANYLPIIGGIIEITFPLWPGVYFLADICWLLSLWRLSLIRSRSPSIYSFLAWFFFITGFYTYEHVLTNYYIDYTTASKGHKWSIFGVFIPVVSRFGYYRRLVPFW